MMYGATATLLQWAKVAELAPADGSAFVEQAAEAFARGVLAQHGRRSASLKTLAPTPNDTP